MPMPCLPVQPSLVLITTLPAQFKDTSHHNKKKATQWILFGSVQQEKNIELVFISCHFSFLLSGPEVIVTNT